MQTEFYNRLLNTCERRGHSLTARFETSDWCYQKSNTYKDFPDLVESCEEAGLHIYKKAMATPPRDADEALLLFDKLMKDINDDIAEIIEASPYLQAAVDNLRAFLESTAKLHAEARKVFFGGIEDATNNKAKPLNTEEELDAAIKSLDDSIKQAVKEALKELYAPSLDDKHPSGMAFGNWAVSAVHAVGAMRSEYAALNERVKQAEDLLTEK